MKKRAVAVFMVGMVCTFIIGCGKNDISVKADNNSASITSEVAEQNEIVITWTTEDNENVDSNTETNEQITWDEMYKIEEEIGLENAVDYKDGIEDILKDQIVLLCTSPSGRYEAYGFISAAYGKQGILINNIIDGEDNYNYFYEKWVYSAEQPALSESDDCYQVTLTICQDEKKGIEEIHFSTYDTGTMAPEEWE